MLSDCRSGALGVRDPPGWEPDFTVPTGITQTWTTTEIMDGGDPFMQTYYSWDLDPEAAGFPYPGPKHFKGVTNVIFPKNPGPPEITTPSTVESGLPKSVQLPTHDESDRRDSPSLSFPVGISPRNNRAAERRQHQEGLGTLR